MSMSLLWLVYHLTGSSLKMGPAASGILIATIDVQHVLHVTADAFVLSILCTIPITIPHQLVPPSRAGILTQAGQALMGAYGSYSYGIACWCCMIVLNAGDDRAGRSSRGPRSPLQQLPGHVSRAIMIIGASSGLVIPIICVAPGATHEHLMARVFRASIPASWPVRYSV